MTDPFAIAIPVFLVLIVSEALLARWRARHRYEMRDAAASLTMGAGHGALSLLLEGATFAFYLAVYEHRLLEIGSGPLAWLACFVAIDLTFYGFHRASHEIRFLWASHVSHHSSQEFNFTTALRQSWTGPFVRALFYWPVPLLGFHPLMILTMGSITLAFGFWTHTRHVERVGWLEHVLVTPSHHRVHHGSDPQYLDRNYGGILIIWDKLFGTFEPERAPVTYGLTRNIHTYNPIRIAFHEWVDLIRDVARARTVRSVLGYLLARPGWAPEGRGITAVDLRRAAIGRP